jgi:hypothetical protein
MEAISINFPRPVTQLKLEKELEKIEQHIKNSIYDALNELASRNMLNSGASIQKVLDIWINSLSQIGQVTLNCYVEDIKELQLSGIEAFNSFKNNVLNIFDEFAAKGKRNTDERYILLRVDPKTSNFSIRSEKIRNSLERDIEIAFYDLTGADLVQKKAYLVFAQLENTIKHPEILNIIKRDIKEFNNAIATNSIKTVLIIGGSLLEGLLLDRLNSKYDYVKNTDVYNKIKKKDLYRWDLNDLINCALELGIIDNSIEKVGHFVREYRNFVHPGKEVNEKFHIEEEKAIITLQILKIVYKNLMEK